MIDQEDGLQKDELTAAYLAGCYDTRKAYERRLAAAEAEIDEARNIAMNMLMRDQAIHAIVKEGYIPDHILDCFPCLKGYVNERS